jgi:hypothetical protein
MRTTACNDAVRMRCARASKSAHRPHRGPQVKKVWCAPRAPLRCARRCACGANLHQSFNGQGSANHQRRVLPQGRKSVSGRGELEEAASLSASGRAYHGGRARFLPFTLPQPLLSAASGQFRGLASAGNRWFRGPTRLRHQPEEKLPMRRTEVNRTICHRERGGRREPAARAGDYLRALRQ